MRNFITNSSPTCLNGITQYQYNANDNLLNDGKHNYLWDAADRLIQITDLKKGQTSEFAYDGYSHRITETGKDANDNITKQLNNLWCGEGLCAQQDENGQTINRFFAQGEVQNNQPYLYAQDQVGSVYALVDDQGNVAGRTAYDPYGNITYQTGTQPIMTYAGLYKHDASDLYLATYRAYNPATARWLNRDPIREMGGLNIYAYVGGDPVNFVDPLGLNATAGIGGLFYESYSFLTGDGFNLCSVYGAFKEGYNGDIYDFSDALYQDSTTLLTVASAGWNYSKYKQDYEYVLKNGNRIAPWGNRTNNKYGKWPHYHRKGLGEGQGRKRHRPWEPKSNDKSWRDRF